MISKKYRILISAAAAAVLICSAELCAVHGENLLKGKAEKTTFSIPKELLKLETETKAEGEGTESELPTLEDFSWYEEVKRNGFWEDAEQITEAEQIAGEWKGYLVHIAEADWDTASQQLAIVTISAEGNRASFSITETLHYSDGNVSDRSSYGALLFEGKYEDQEFYLVGPGNIRMNTFREYEGKQYAMGMYRYPDGMESDFCLVREKE